MPFMNHPRPFHRVAAAVACAFAAFFLTGCAHPEFNPSAPASESDSLSDVVQLTSGFDKAGEAYFSADMQWVIFQAVPHGEQQYQMYVARAIRNVEDRSPPLGSVVRAPPTTGFKFLRVVLIEGLVEPIRISPPN